MEDRELRLFVTRNLKLGLNNKLPVSCTLTLTSFQPYSSLFRFGLGVDNSNI